MSPTNADNEILNDSNYFIWEFNARMALARKNLLDHVLVKPKTSEAQKAEWKVRDMKALGIIAKMMSVQYQGMIREATSAMEAWETLRSFFVKASLHNKVQLKKELHEFEMSPGSSLMEHLLKFDEICMKLSGVGDKMDDTEKLVILLGSLPSEYDGMVRIIESKQTVSLLEAKEMLRREYELNQKRDKKEGAFQVKEHKNYRGSHRGRSQGRGRHGKYNGDRYRNFNKKYPKQHEEFKGKCFGCNQFGHKKVDCPNEKSHNGNGEFAFTATGMNASDTWLLDSGASSHMTSDISDFMEFKKLQCPLSIYVANGQKIDAIGVGSIKFLLENGNKMKITDVLYVPKLDRKVQLYRQKEPM
jgi:hypothetical protein